MRALPRQGLISEAFRCSNHDLLVDKANACSLRYENKLGHQDCGYMASQGFVNDVPIGKLGTRTAHLPAYLFALF